MSRVFEHIPTASRWREVVFRLFGRRHKLTTEDGTIKAITLRGLTMITEFTPASHTQDGEPKGEHRSSTDADDGHEPLTGDVLGCPKGAHDERTTADSTNDEADQLDST